MKLDYLFLIKKMFCFALLKNVLLSRVYGSLFIHQVVKKGREYIGCGEEYNLEKRERGTNIIFPIILRLLGRISSVEKRKGTEFSGMKIEI